MSERDTHCLSSTLARLASVDRLRVHGKGKGPFTPPKPPLLIQDASYAVEQAFSIIKEEDIDNCDEYAPGSINESELQGLIKVLSFSYPFARLSTICLFPNQLSTCLSGNVEDENP